MCYGMGCRYEDYMGECKVGGQKPEGGKCQPDFVCSDCDHHMDNNEEQCPICGGEDIVEE